MFRIAVVTSGDIRLDLNLLSLLFADVFAVPATVTTDSGCVKRAEEGALPTTVKVLIRPDSSQLGVDFTPSMIALDSLRLGDLLPKVSNAVVTLHGVLVGSCLL